MAGIVADIVVDVETGVVADIMVDIEIGVLALGQVSWQVL
jgi:hypothetical protein